MDLKRLFLVTIRKGYLVLLAALTGALIGCACYLMVHVVYAPEREYEAISKLYIDFEERSTGEAYQYYNGYTWDDLMKTDPILDVTMELLPASYDREQVAASIRADILTDIRLLTITVRTHDPQQTKEILAATQRSLANFAVQMRELEAITVFRTTEPKLVVFELQTGRVAAVCAVLCGIFAIFLLLLYYAMDDSIYLPIDVTLRYGLPVLGFRGYKEQDLEDNLSYRYRDKQMMTISFEDCLALTKEGYEKLRGAGAIVLEVPCGRPIGRKLQAVLEKLALQDCPVDAIILTQSDRKFLDRYYGRRHKEK